MSDYLRIFNDTINPAYIREEVNKLVDLGHFGRECFKEIINSPKADSAISLPIVSYMDLRVDGNNEKADVFLKLIPHQKQLLAEEFTKDKVTYKELFNRDYLFKSWKKYCDS